MKGGIPALAARVVVTLGLLTLLVFVVADPREIAGLITGARPGPLVIAVALSAADRGLMAYKWWLLLRARRLAVRLRTAVRAYFASSLVGMILPVTVGADAVRILALRQAGALEVTASIVIERALGVIAMASVGLVSCVLLANAGATIDTESLALWLLAAVGAGVSLFVGSLVAADAWAGGRHVAPTRVRRAAEAYGQHRRHPAVLVLFYALSVAESLMSAVIAYVVAVALGVTLPLHLLMATVPLALAVARLPISLGGFGVQEASFVFLGGLVGVPRTHALSIMIVMDVAMLIAVLPSAFDSSMLALRRRAADERML